MNPEFLAPLIPITAIIAFAVVKIVGMRAKQATSPDVIARLESLEHGYHALQEELAETQERLDFAERLLSKPADERRIGN